MGKFNSPDFIELDSLLSEEERMVRDMVRDWVDTEFMPIINEHFERGEFPRSVIPQLGELGLLGSNLPEKYGCSEINNVAYGLVMQELERGDSGLRSFASVQGALVMYPIFQYGSEDQKLKYLPKLASGEFIGCFGLTEPDHGSDPGSMKTYAVRQGNEFILNGSKMWITNGSIADIAVVWAKLDGRIRGFLVEKGTPGFTAPEIKNKMSLRASVTSELLFDDCHIPTSNILPEAEGLRAPLSCLTQARYGIAWGAMGAAMACYHEALEYAKERIQFDKPIASFQLVQEKLVNMLNEITKMQAITLQVGRLKDEGRSDFAHISLIKRNNVYNALHIARTARDILGAAGIVTDFQAMRHMTNLESVYTYEGTHDIHTLILGHQITGIPAYK